MTYISRTQDESVTLIEIDDNKVNAFSLDLINALNAALDEVPRRAISMSIMQIMGSRAIICTVPDGRKAQAVHNCFTGEVTPLHPASILRKHDRAHVFLDADAAALLRAGGSPNHL